MHRLGTVEQEVDGRLLRKLVVAAIAEYIKFGNKPQSKDTGEQLVTNKTKGPAG